MFFSKQAMGIEICQDEVRLVLLDGKRTKPRLGAYVIPSFPAGTVRLSSKEPNVQNPQAFVTSIRESYLRLVTKEQKISVSLPDSIGRAILLEMETRFKSRDEGNDLIRWKLKKSFPFDINEGLYLRTRKTITDYVRKGGNVDDISLGMFDPKSRRKPSCCGPRCRSS